MLRQYIKLANTTSPQTSVLITSDPQLAIIIHHDDLAQQDAEYESIVALHTGYAINQVPLSLGLAKKALGSMATTTFSTLPTELKLMIFEFSLPRGRLIRNNYVGRAFLCGHGENETDWTMQKIVPASLQVNKDMRETLLAGYFRAQAFHYSDQGFITYQSLLELIQSRGFKFFEMRVVHNKYVAAAGLNMASTSAAHKINMAKEVSEVVNWMQSICGRALKGSILLRGYYEPLPMLTWEID